MWAVVKRKKILGINSSLFFKFSLIWGSYFKIALPKGTCNVSFDQIAPALQFEGWIDLDAALEEDSVDICVWWWMRYTYIYVYIYKSRGHKERLAGYGQLLSLHERKREKSSWLCMGVKSKHAFSKCILVSWWVARNTRRGGEGSLGSLQRSFHKTKQSSKPQPGRGRRGKASVRYREAMSRRCWEANSQRAGERGHLCPCRSHYRSATRPVTQRVKARVISRTDNWTLILVDIVVGMICQADRAYVLASADRLRTKGMFGRLDLGPRRCRAGDDTAINHELPSWAAFPKTVGPCFFGGGGHGWQNDIDPRACTRASVCVKIYVHV